jgi:hypothetical protein
VQTQQLDEKTSNIKTYTSSCKEINMAYLRVVLGPILFLLFRNDLLQAVQEAKMVLFIDNTNILLIEKDLTYLKGKVIKVMKQLQNCFLIKVRYNKYRNDQSNTTSWTRIYTANNYGS